MKKIFIYISIFLIFTLVPRSNFETQAENITQTNEKTNTKHKYVPIAHIDRIYDGKITRENLLKQEGISVFAYEKIEIISFEMIFRNGFSQVLKSDSNLFTLEMKDVFLNRPYSSNIIFHQILAVNQKKDTILLNPIKIIITKTTESPRKIYTLISYPTICGLYDGHIKKALLARGEITSCSKNWKIIKFQFDWWWQDGF